MSEWLYQDNLKDAVHTTQGLIKELANASDEIVDQVECRPVGVVFGNAIGKTKDLIRKAITP